MQNEQHTAELIKGAIAAHLDISVDLLIDLEASGNLDEVVKAVLGTRALEASQAVAVDNAEKMRRIDDFMVEEIFADQSEQPWRADDFKGDNAHLIDCIDAFLDLNDDHAMTPTNLGKGHHAYRLLCAARHRLTTPTRIEAAQQEAVEATRAWAVRLANMRQGQSSSPRCEPPGEADIERARKMIKQVLAASPPLYTTPPIQASQADAVKVREALDWAIAEIEGRTRYSPDVYTGEEQREEALAKAKAALNSPIQAAKSGLLDEARAMLVRVVYQASQANPEAIGFRSAMIADLNAVIAVLTKAGKPGEAGNA